MKSVAILGAWARNFVLHNEAVVSLEVEGVPIHCGLVKSHDTCFDGGSPDNSYNVLVKKKAFSCNYRDKSLIFLLTKEANEKYKKDSTQKPYTYFGSDFVGEVVAAGPEVTALQVGDRVMANCSYPQTEVTGATPGIPSNSASKAHEIIHCGKLMKVPKQMPDEVAAAFSIGAQTTYSMIRKLHIRGGENVLVTAAKSNTSLFAINALKNMDVNVYATTTSMRFEKELKEMDVKALIKIDPESSSFLENEQIRHIVARLGGFDCVIDPLFDIHLGKAVDVMNYGARYVTCGFYDQYSSLIGKDVRYTGKRLREVMTACMLKNLHIIGNCIGQTGDLRRAVDDYVSGSLDVILDSVFSGHEIDSFLNKTYNAKDRFGKVVYRYD